MNIFAMQPPILNGLEKLLNSYYIAAANGCQHAVYFLAEPCITTLFFPTLVLLSARGERAWDGRCGRSRIAPASRHGFCPTWKPAGATFQSHDWPTSHGLST